MHPRKYRRGQRVMVRVDRKPDRWVPGVICWGSDGESIAEVTTRLGDVDVRPVDLKKFDPARELWQMDRADHDWMTAQMS